MLTQIQQNKLKTILDGKIASVDEFTAFELTKLLRKSEYVMHSDVRDYVHSFMTDYISLGEYERTVYDQDGWSAYKYIPKQETDSSIDSSIDSSTDSSSNDSTLIDTINNYFSDVNDSIIAPDSNTSAPRVIGATSGSFGIAGTSGTSSNKSSDDNDSNSLFDDSDTRELSDLIGEEFRLQTNNRINIPEKVFGSNVNQIYVYLDNSDLIVVTTDLSCITSAKTRPHKISKSQKAFRFTLNPYLSDHKKNSIDYNISEIQDVEEHSKGKFSLFLDVY